MAGFNAMDARAHYLEAVARMKREGAPNDLLARMRADPQLGPHVTDDVIDPARYVGRAPEQVDDFLAQLEDELRPHEGRAGRFEPLVRV